MELDLVFYLFVFVFVVITLFLFFRHVAQIKEHEIEQQRQLAQHRQTVQVQREKNFKEERESHSRYQANILKDFHVEHFGLNMPIKPVSAVIEVKSMSERHVKYEVDLGKQTCTCENFKKRAHHPKNHVARWCKHLLKTFDESGAFDPLEGLHAEVVKFEYTQCDKMYLIKHRELPEMIITLSHDSLSRDWIDINARKKRVGENVRQASGRFERFGWNLYQERWSYGDGPPGASLLRPLLKMVDAYEIEDLLEKMCRESNKISSVGTSLMQQPFETL